MQLSYLKNTIRELLARCLNTIGRAVLSASQFVAPKMQVPLTSTIEPSSSYRKASQAITASHPLKNDKGEATPAALQFKRWAAKVPQNQEDLRELKALGARLKERYKPKNES
jgi:hypothetical protein